MKLIFSRKGFDSSTGGVPSPIFPDGSMVSLPIPDKNSVISYEDIATEHGPLGRIVADLTRGRIPSHYKAHLDPDVVPSSLPRLPGWRALFGQTAQAQSHLRNHSVGPGDLFLFFGIFRRVRSVSKMYTWRDNSRPCHVIWGWMEIEEVVPLGTSPDIRIPWAEYHPHFHRPNDRQNVLYIARQALSAVDSLDGVLPGAGAFRRYAESLQLTDEHTQKTTRWRVPHWLKPEGTRTPLSYHRNPNRWEQRGEQLILNAVARGQEFVLDCDQYPEAIPWAHHLIRRNERRL